MESRKRSLVKALIWNIIGLSVMTLVGLAMTGSVGLGGTMALINAALGFATYLLYERVWANIGWGRGSCGDDV